VAAAWLNPLCALGRQARWALPVGVFVGIAHIDHIKPLCGFDLTNPEHLKIVCHFEQIQPFLLYLDLLR